MSAPQPSRTEINRVLLWVMQEPMAAKVVLVKNLRSATNSGLKDAVDVINDFIADVENITSPHLRKQRNPEPLIDPDTIDAQRELADLDEMERAWMQE